MRRRIFVLILNCSPRLALAASILFLSMLCQGIFMAGHANAIVNNNEQIPDSIRNVYEPENNICISGNAERNYGQDYWLSPPGAPRTTVIVPSIDIPYGQSSQKVWMNTLSSVCNGNITKPIYPDGDIIGKYIQITNYRNVGVAWAVDGSPPAPDTVVISGLQDTGMQLHYGKAYLFKNRYIVENDPWNSTTPVHTEFTVSGLDKLSVGEHTIRIFASTRAIHLSEDGKYRCIELNLDGSIRMATSLEDSNCGYKVVALDLNVNILPGTAGALDGAFCTVNQGLHINGWALDKETPSNTLDVHFYFWPKGVSTGPATAGYPSGPADTYRPDVPPVVGSQFSSYHGFSTDSNRNGPPQNDPKPIPKSWIDANLPPGEYDVYAFIIGKGPDGKTTGVNPRIDKHGTFNTADCGPPPRYDLIPSASCDLANNQINWTVNKTGTAALASTALTTRYRVDGGAWQSGNQPATLTAFPWNGTTSLPLLPPGSRVYVEMTVNPGQGPSGAAPVSYNSGGIACGTKVNRPYFQVWRSDIWVGGRYGKFDGQRTVADPSNGNTCAPYENVGSPGTTGKTGAVRGFGVLKPKTVGANTIEEVFGSFVEYGVFATGRVDGSVGNRNVFTKPISEKGGRLKLSGGGPLRAKELTFGNWQSGPGDVNGTFGENHCLHDYYGEYKPQANRTVPAGVTDFDVMDPAITDGIYYSDHSINLINRADKDLPKGNGLNDAWYKDKRIILIVDGTVTVKKDIFFTGSGGVISPDTDTTNPSPNLSALLEDLPYLMVIAKGSSSGGGNIFFDKDVDRADGVWVAQPHISSNRALAGTGIIDTCTNGSSQVVGSASFYATCGGDVPADQFVCYREYEDRCDGIPGFKQRRITIKGALIAEKVLLTRLPGDVTTTPKAYAAPGFPEQPDQVDNRNKSNAAERIKVSPELYFSQPPKGNGSTSKPYDLYEILPPLL